MRMRLTELNPEWLRHPETHGRLGVAFECPAHNGGGHRLSVYFSLPPDGDDAVTLGDGNRVHFHTGNDFETLSYVGPVVDADVFVFCYDGEVVTG